MGGAFKTGGTSICITFTIKDCDLDNGHTWDGLRIKYFKETESLLPPVRVRILQGKLTGVVAQNVTVPYAIFRPDREPTSNHSALTGPEPFEPTYAEKTYAASLLEASPGRFHRATVSRANFAQVTASKPTTTNRKFSLLEDIQEGQFVDLIGEIVKIFGNDSEKATLYLTDYTSNDKLFHYASDNNDDLSHGREGDPYGYIQRQAKRWNGPSGRMSLQITLWEPHASFVRGNFQIGEIVRLKNVKIKKSYAEEGILEGVIHGSRDNPSMVNALKVNLHNDSRAQQLLSRKQAYLEAHPKKQKRKSDEDDDRPSKKPNKRQSKTAPRKESGQTILDINKRMAVNENVKARVPLSGVHALSLEAIINNPSHNNSAPRGITYRLPFQNLCYLTTVRVVDFYPPRLEDFAVQQEAVSIAYNRNRDPATSRTYKKWEWRFCLLVENAPRAPARKPNERIKLFVSDLEAEHLLGMSAVE
ncbi:telomere-binding alpha subunit central domain protein [Aspergillus mulundensis]|uniref:Protection of telomeres protein 1 n=1 Tax=Aspergillus mulundensis TaxID=1810919 RepID=A0A3D8RXP0_9EURO|nr:Pot1-like protein [Aspergillus mulundensis]RDW78614.1 Pot1-like protein [Aspergillus mulundensis]